MAASIAEKVGPGIWFLIHKKALLATTMPEQLSFINFITEICTIFPCENCVEHCKTYMVDNPPSNNLGMISKEKEEQIGMFVWSWNFHNDVNIKLGKKVVDWPTAYNMYATKKSLCNKVCTAEH